jgi:hypothetical protein
MFRIEYGRSASSTFLVGQGAMGHGRLSRKVWFPLLLVASAIQGATPDAQDLASIKALSLFNLAAAPSDSLASDDGLPDEVCAPAQTRGHQLIRNAKCTPLLHPTFGTTGSFAIAFPSSVVLSPARYPRVAHAGDLITSRCRINC